jgi:arylsulfatase A-like enzyme
MKKKTSLDKRIKKYNNAVCSIDEGLGRIMKALEKSGQRQNTIVIFTSDQGFAMGEHGLSTKWLPYDANIRAPMIVSWPDNFAQNKVCKQPINGTDITCTIHAIAGIDLPWRMHGRNFLSLLKNPEEKWNVSPMIMMQSKYSFGTDLDTVLKNKSFKKMKYHGSYAWIMLIEGGLKYIRYMKDNCIEELYDLQKDPDELYNLAVSPTYQNKLKILRKKAIDEFKKKGGSFVNLLPEVKIRIMEN